MDKWDSSFILFSARDMALIMSFALMLGILPRHLMSSIIKYSISTTDRIFSICLENFKLLISTHLLPCFQLLGKDTLSIPSTSIWVHSSTHLSQQDTDCAKESSGPARSLPSETTLPKEVHSIQSNNQQQSTESRKKQDNYGVTTITKDMELMSEVSGTQVLWVGNQIQEEVQLTTHLRCFKQQ